MFLIADPREILAGRVTDVYFDRAMTVLRARGVNPVVRAEIVAKGFPLDWPWAILTGTAEAMDVLKGRNVNVRAMQEGSLFYPYEPVMEIEGRYQDFCVFETALLGILCQASGISTQASRIKLAAGDRLVMSFGARRMHPAIAPMIERNAYVGGCDGVSVVRSGEIIGQDPMGTMPHSLVLCMGSTLAAAKAYDEVLPPNVKRVVLIDTFQDEKFEVLQLAREMGDRLFAVRFDTPLSRRGDFFRILQEARWELDIRGHDKVRFFVSGGIKETDIPRLNPLVNGYGIGTTISNAPVIDFALDIVEIDGVPLAKRGKWSGSKSVLVCGSCDERRIVPRQDQGSGQACGRCEGTARDALAALLEKGALLSEPESPEAVREFVMQSMKKRIHTAGSLQDRR